MGYWFDCLIKFGLISSAWECLPCWHSPAWRRHGEAAAACEICTELTIMEDNANDVAPVSVFLALNLFHAIHGLFFLCFHLL